MLPDGADRCFATSFARALLDPALPAPAGLQGPGGGGAEWRFNVYRNNVTVSLIDALAAIFPVVRRLTGDDFFRAMARGHVRATPPTSPLLFEYGHDFPAFVARYEHAREVPWLADVARIERAWLDAYHAADEPPLVAGALAGIAAEALGGAVFTPHPAARLVRSAFPAASIYLLHRRDAPPEPFCSDVAEDALVTRPLLDVAVRVLQPGCGGFLARLLAGDALADAAGAALAETPGFDLPGALSTLLESGAFISVHAGEAP